MAMVVKNNMSAVRTMNTLNNNSTALQKSLAKVSSGMKINSAQDDASGYAISEKMRVRIRSLDQANQNTQNDSSMMKTAEGAVSSTVEILKALKEKAINAANDSNTDADRATIQKEMNQFIDQIDDNALVQFNGKYLVDGSKNYVGQATKTAFTNQSLDKGTENSTKLTDLKNRNGESLEISSTDKITASYVKDGKTFSTTFDVGESTLEDVFINLNTLNDNAGVFGSANVSDLNALTKSMTFDQAKTKFTTAIANGSQDFQKIINKNNPDEDLQKAITILSQVDKDGLAIEGSGKSYLDSALDGYTKALSDQISADLTAAQTATLALADHTPTGVYFKTTDNGTANQRNITPGNNTTTAGDGDAVTFAAWKSGASAMDGARSSYVTGKNGAGDAVGELVAQMQNAAIAAATGKTTTTAETNIENFAKSIKYSDADGTVTNEHSTAASALVDANAPSAAATDTDEKWLTYSSKESTATEMNDLQTNVAAAQDVVKNFAGAQTAIIAARNLVNSSDKIGYGTSGDMTYTADSTPGLTITAAGSGVAGQISGVNISITDSQGNVKKAANAALDQFKETVRAQNKSDDNALNFQVGAEANVAIKVGLTDMRSEALGLKGSDGQKLSVATKTFANAAVNVIDNAISKAVDQQTTIGASLARLEYTSSNLTTSSENVQAAESTIRDADMAKEMTNYTKNNVLLQAAQSMLAQANQNSSAVLSLLQ